MIALKHSMCGSGLIRAEYIEANGRQWIDTGVVSSPTVAAEVVAMTMGLSDYASFFGWSHGDDVRGIRLRCYAQQWFGKTWDSNIEWVLNVSDGVRHVTVIDSLNNRFSVDGKMSTAIAFQGWASTYYGEQGNILVGVCGRHPYSYDDPQMTFAGYIRFYGVRIWDNSTLVRDFVPVCMRENGKFVGTMLDNISGKVFPVLGSEPFNTDRGNG